MTRAADLVEIPACQLCRSTELETLDAETCLRACTACGFVFDSPRPSPEAIAEFYSREGQYDGWLAAEPSRDRLWQRRLRIVLRHKRSGRLLDAGAGIGQFLDHARPYFAEVTGTEVSRSAIAVAQRQFGLRLHSGSLETVNADALGLFDVITLFHVLEHVPDPDKALDCARELLSPGGVLVLAVPNDLDAAKQRIKAWLGRRGVERYRRLGSLVLPRLVLDGSTDEIHVSHFRVPVLRKALAARGFRTVAEMPDPYKVSSGAAETKDHALWLVSVVVQRLTGRNWYDASLVIAVKS